ncbi:MAG: hypothetical protein J0H43_12420, partial [Actinobacteria bacterium]|nr:hypothetical protein [Actinomycetota bacterium]
FLSSDPILETMDPDALNGYDYSDNNPMTKSDPTGARPLCEDQECYGTRTASGAAGVTVTNNNDGGGYCDTACQEANEMQQVSDPSYGSQRYGGVQAKVTTRTFTPIGGGIIRIGLFIPTASVDGDRGDNRTFETNFDPSNTRVTIYIDLDTGIAVARQNPSCIAGTNSCKVHSINSFYVTQLKDGTLDISYDAANAEHYTSATLSGTTVSGYLTSVEHLTVQYHCVEMLVCTLRPRFTMGRRLFISTTPPESLRAGYPL